MGSSTIEPQGEQASRNQRFRESADGMAALLVLETAAPLEVPRDVREGADAVDRLEIGFPELVELEVARATEPERALDEGPDSTQRDDAALEKEASTVRCGAHVRRHDRYRAERVARRALGERA
jgi:hypothetical protein